MFAKKTKAILKCLGAERELIYNDNLNETIELFTLVKVSKNRLKKTLKYSFMDITLFDLLKTDGAKTEEEPNEINVEEFVFKSKIVLENIFTSSKNSSGSQVKAGNAIPGLGETSAGGEMTTEDSASSFTLMRDMANLKKLRREYSNEKIKDKLGDKINQRKTEKLAFVYQCLYNNSGVELRNKAKGKGSFKSWTITAKSSSKVETNFTVPTEATFAFGLMEIKIIKDNELDIPIRIRKVARSYNDGPQNLEHTAKNTKKLTKSDQ